MLTLAASVSLSGADGLWIKTSS